MTVSWEAGSDRQTAIADPTVSTGHRPLGQVVGIGVGVSAVLTLILALFVSSAVKAKPHEVAIDVVGPAAAVTQVRAALSAAGQDAFVITAVADEQTAAGHLQDRTADGAVVVGANGPRVLTASAGSPVIAQLLSTAAAGLSGQSPSTLVTDVVPVPSSDPRGAGIASAAFPMILAGLGAGALAGLVLRRTRERVVLIVTSALASGLLFTGVLEWLGVIDGHYWAVAGAIALSAGASATFVSGTVALLGAAGMGVAALVMMIIGNPLAGVATSPKLVPAPWGAVGQLLPPGAGGTLLRTAAYFPQAPVWTPVLTLCAWIALGAAGIAVAHRRASVTPIGGSAVGNVTTDETTTAAEHGRHRTSTG